MRARLTAALAFALAVAVAAAAIYLGVTMDAAYAVIR